MPRKAGAGRTRADPARPRAGVVIGRTVCRAAGVVIGTSTAVGPGARRIAGTTGGIDREAPATAARMTAAPTAGRARVAAIVVHARRVRRDLRCHVDAEAGPDPGTMMCPAGIAIELTTSGVVGPRPPVVVLLPQGASEISRVTGTTACRARMIVRAGAIRNGGRAETVPWVTVAAPDVGGRMREAVCARAIRVGHRLVGAVGHEVGGM
jgi:hypothetical protein